MSCEDLQSRLSQIVTAWSMLAAAHEGPTDSARSAQQLLMERYGGAIHRYLMSALRDPALADELTQEFALALVRGEFKHADPNRGRFRNYLKSALFHLVSKQRKKLKKQAVQISPEAPELEDAVAPDAETDREFNESWRAELLSRSWDALSQVQPTFYLVLRFRAEHPKMPSEELAQELSQTQNKAWTPGGVRQTLRRAREKFADLLLDQVAQSLQFPDARQIEEELSDLGLLEYCRPALERYKG